MFQAICPYCNESNDLSQPIEIPTRCVECFKAFEPVCLDCHKVMHACQCRGSVTRKVTPSSVKIRATAPPMTHPIPDDNWRTPPERLPENVLIRPKRADTEPVARTRTITSDRQLVALDPDDKEALNHLRDCSDYADPLDRDRDRLLVYLVETMSRIENMLAGAPPDVLEDIRDVRDIQRKS